MRFHSGSLAETPRETSGEPKTRSIAIIAARRWPSSAAASHVSRLHRLPGLARPHAVLVRGTRIAHQPDEPAIDEKCTLCGNGLVKKHGRFGEFIGCSRAYPKCKYTRPYTPGASNARGAMRRYIDTPPQRPARGRTADARAFFTGARITPDCDFTTPHMTIAEPCPKCGAAIHREKRSKIGTVPPASRRL